MTDVWKNILKKYIADFHAIDKLQADNIIEDEDTYKLKNKLLVDIICTFESEVNEQFQIHGFMWEVNMFINFFTAIFCAAVAVWHGYNGNVGLCLMEVVFMLVNLPMAIKWLIEYFNE